jgi:hypothetical protein
VDQLPHPRVVGGVENRAAAADTDGVEVFRVASGLKAPREVNDAVCAVEKRAQPFFRVGFGDVDLMPACSSVRVGVRRPASGDADDVVFAAGQGESAQQRGTDVAAGSRDDDPSPHEQAIPRRQASETASSAQENRCNANRLSAVARILG